MRRLVLPLVSAVWCVSCATPGLNARRAEVVQTSTPPADCVLLGPINGSDESIDLRKSWEYMQIGPSRTAAITEALDQAGAKGATHAYLPEPTRLERGFSVEGMAYDCSSRATTAAPAPPAAASEATPAALLGCSKDTDCKGVRICRNRECVDP